jgi:opacity protein-like surface antigen
VETTSLTANVGVTVPLNQKLSFEASFGLGYTSVSHSHNMVIVTSNLDVLSDSGFSYELSLLLDYSFSERLSAFLGYRLAGIPENNGSNIAFDSVNAHLFELGLGMNF